jgi:hypothetical protein
VNFPPYLLTLDLQQPIQDRTSIARFLDGTLELELPKAEAVEWTELEVRGLSKSELLARRRASMEKREAEDAALNVARKQRKQEANDLAFRRQMALEHAEREELEHRKAEEKHAAEEEVYAALAKYRAASPTTKTKDLSSDQGAEPAKKAQPTDEGEIAKTEAAEKKEEDAAAVVAPAASLPAPRPACGRVAIRFTERQFPTPLRASKKAEEDDWLARNRHLIDARKRAMAVDSDQAVPISERDREWRSW